MLNKSDVKHIAQLAHLKLNEEEIETFARQLDNILEYIDKLNELDTGGVVPTAYTVPMKNVFREDRVEPSFSREKALTNAPEKRDGQFKVPPIIGGDSD